MSSNFEQNKKRITEAAKNLTNPPLSLLRGMYLQRQQQEQQKFYVLERELEELRNQAYQAALRLYLSLYGDEYTVHGSYVDIIRAIEGDTNE